ncbi:MAG: beta-lactamase family protein [Acidobacteriota bacterium]|nr:beta-lactamase family protein [Acidobacteriota bacterium]
MKRVAAVVFAIAFAFSLAAAPNRACKATFPGVEWQTAASQEGWSAEKLAAAKAFSKEIGSMAWILVQHGEVIDQYGPVEQLNSLHSARKSIVSAMFGIASNEKKVRLGSTLARLHINDVEPSLTPTEKTATVRNLLMARSGVYHAALGESPAMKKGKPARGSHAPGTFWYYNNWDFNALGTILNHATGQSLFDYFRDRIAIPLQMQDFEDAAQRYVSGEESRHDYYDFRLSARDMARFGYLFLQQGCWNGKQIVPAQWVKESTRPYSDTVSDVFPQGMGFYGYMWWIAHEGKFIPNAHVPDGSFAALGVGPQVILVVPEKDIVFVHRTNTSAEDAKLIPTPKVGTLIEMVVSAYERGR